LEAYRTAMVPFTPPLELLWGFRDMINFCIKAGLKHGASSRFRLSNLMY